MLCMFENFLFNGDISNWNTYDVMNMKYMISESIFTDYISN